MGTCALSSNTSPWVALTWGRGDQTKKECRIVLNRANPMSNTFEPMPRHASRKICIMSIQHVFWTFSSQSSLSSLDVVYLDNTLNHIATNDIMFNVVRNHTYRTMLQYVPHHEKSCVSFVTTQCVNCWYTSLYYETLAWTELQETGPIGHRTGVPRVPCLNRHVWRPIREERIGPFGDVPFVQGKSALETYAEESAWVEPPNFPIRSSWMRREACFSRLR